MKIFYNLILLCIALFPFSRAAAQAPVVTSVSGSSAVCSAPGQASGFTIQATNSPGAWTWSVSPSNGVSIGSPLSQSTTISFPHSTAVYTIYVTASNGSGTSAVYQHTVMVYETPDVTFSGNTTFCMGSSTSLQASSTIYAASPTISYSWTPANGLNTTTGPLVSAAPATQTTYTVIAVKGMCSNTGTITVTPIPSPTLVVTASSTVVCSGQSATLTASGASTYTWTGGIVNGLGFVPAFTGVYYVNATGSNGCEAWSYVNMVVNPTPTVQVSSSSPTLCIGQTATLTINGSAQSYSLNGTATPTTAAVSPSMTTTYNVIAMNSYGCTGTASLTQQVASCAGLEEQAFADRKFLIYPNPSNGSFTVRCETQQTLEVLSATGAVVMSLQCEAGETRVENALPPGVYLIKAGNRSSRIVITD